MIAVREFTSAAECIAHAQAVHRKFYSQQKGRKVVEEAKVVPVSIPKFLHLQPRWKKDPMHFDAHVNEWRLELLARASPVKAYIRRRAGELGYTYDDMMVRTRKKARIYAKHTIIWEIKRIVKPTITLTELARHFGLDHTTCISALRKVDARKAAELAGGEA